MRAQALRRSLGTWGFACLALVLAGCGSESGEESRAPEPFIRIKSPEAGAILTGRTPVELEYQLPPGAERVEVGVDSDLMTMRSLFSQVTLKTIEYPDQEHRIVARVTGPNQEVWEDSVVVVFDNADQRLASHELSALAYRPGDTIEIKLKYTAEVELALDFSALDSAYDAAAVVIESRGAGEYVARYTLPLAGVAPDGTYPVVATTTAANGERTRYELPVVLNTTPDLPVEVPGAVFVAGAPPAPEHVGASALRITELSGDTNILTGGSTQLKLAWEQRPEFPVTQVFLAARGFSGYYVLPIEPQAGPRGEMTLTVDLPPLKPGFEGGSLDFLGGIADGIGGAIDWISEAGAAIAVGGRGIQVSLEWDTPVDLDLSVTDPMGRLIDFESRQVEGGALDLDSNAACVIDGVNKENIAWEPGDEVQGVHQVRVNLYDSCGESSVNWEVTASFCGRTEKISGTLSAGNVDMSGAGTAVTEFTVDCNQVVQGSVSYAKLSGGSVAATSSTTTFVPVPFAPIRIVSEGAAPTTLAQGVTDRDGGYKFQFQNLDEDDYRIEVEASWVDPGTNEVRTRVLAPGESSAYRFRSAVIDGAGSMVRTEDLKIGVDQDSGAFNIRDIARRGFEWVKTNTSAAQSSSLPDLDIDWKRGVTPPGGTSYFQGGKLFILSSPTDADEFDDPVLAHEFMHYAVNTLSAPGPGGPHNGRSKPDLAWSEGIATGFGLDAIGQDTYRDESKSGVMAIAVETLDPARTGTDGNTRTGNVDEFLISALLFDLLDPANEPHDKSQDRGNTFFVAFDHIKGGFVDRDGNGVDLVDFIDGYSSRTQGGQDGQVKCLTDHLSFPYDFAAGTACPP